MMQAFLGFFRSVAIRNIVAFLVILFLVVVPLATFYLADTRQNLTDVLSANLSVASQRGASQIDRGQVALITNPNYLFTSEHTRLVEILGRIQTDFRVDNAVIYRRANDGGFVYVADGNNIFDIGSPVVLHTRFPETRQAAVEAWTHGTIDDTRLFESGKSQFFQINVPLKDEGKVVAVLMLNDDATVVAQAIALRQKYIVSGIAGVMVLGTLAFWFISYMTLRPLTRLRRAALQVSAGNLEIQIPPQRGRNEIAELNQSFRDMLADLRENRAKLEDYNQTLERRIEERTREIGSLLNNMDEGIFSITPAGDFLPGHSAATEGMVGAMGEGNNLFRTLALDQDQIKNFQETFGLLLNPSMGLDWDDMVKFLPSEFHLDSARWLHASFRPVNDGEGNRLERVMVILRDITKEKALQQDLGAKQAQQEMIVKILQNRETFEFFYEDALKLLGECSLTLEGMTTVQRGRIDEVFRAMHTIKGTASLFGLEEVSQKAHQAEELLRDLREHRDAELTDAQRVSFIQDAQALIQLLTTTRETILELTGESGGGQKSFLLSDKKIQKLRQEILALVPTQSQPAAEQLFGTIPHVPTARLLKKYESLVHQLGEKLGKEVGFRFDDSQETELEPEFFKRLDASLLHVIRNALDHGIEGPEERLEHGKEPLAHVTIGAHYLNGGIKFTIADDGRGIDPSKVLKVGKARGFVNLELADSMTEEEIIRLLFIPGFSSAESLTDVSGRGVGLDVVRTEIHHMKGRLKVITNLGVGTTFEFYFPNMGKTAAPLKT